MARRTQLLELVQMVREECGRSSAVSVGLDDLPAIKTKLRRTQVTLYNDFDWPHLFTHFDPKQLSAGQRFYDPPIGLNFDRIAEKGVSVKYSGNHHPLDRGITYDDYNAYNSDDDDRAEPAQKWDVRYTGPIEQIEVWPIPTSNDQEIHFKGIRNLNSLVANSDRADLDDHMLACFVAAELLTTKDDKAAATVLQMAQRLLNKLTGRSQNNVGPYCMGMGAAEPKKPTFVVRAN